MGLYRFGAFVGAVCLTFNLFPFFALLSLYFKGVAALCALFGACYFLIKVDEYRYGIVMILVCVMAQPFLSFGLGGLLQFVADIFCIVMFLLTGSLARMMEKQAEAEHAKNQAEIEALQRKEAAIRRRINQ